MSLSPESSMCNEINTSHSDCDKKEENTHSEGSGTESSSEIQNFTNKGCNKMIFVEKVGTDQSGSMSTQVPGTSQTMLQHAGNTQQKLFEVILQSLHVKQLENKQLRERCAHLELKMRMDSYEKQAQSKTDNRNHSHTSKEPVSRSKSAPECSQKQSIHHVVDVRKSSDPQIFVFPDTKGKLNKKTMWNKDNTSKSRSSDNVSEDGLKDSLENPDSGSQGEDSNEFLGLKDSFQEPAGVSAQYFNNVINELLKTKTYLHNLQMKQRCHKCEEGSENEMGKMRNEIQQLRFRNQHLQRELAAKEEEMAKVKPEPAPVKEESFELSTESEAELSESYKDESAQIISVEEIKRLKEENEELIKQNHMILQEKDELKNMLMKDNYEINRELIQLNDAYDKLKADVKILSTCLQEEKLRSKNLEEKLKTKAEETRKISVQLGSLRQHYEELRQEKNALEKTRSLEDTPSARFSSPRSQMRSAEYSRSGGSNRSAEYARYGSNYSNPSPLNSRSGTFDSYNIRPEAWPPRGITQNNLSSVENEPKVSNLPQFGSSPKYECPRCLRKFQVENSYLLHLQSCIE